MSPIKFDTRTYSSVHQDSLFEQVLILDNWQSFSGFGPVPGIAKAEFINEQSEIQGRRIAVTNTDGSSHVEEIKRWEPPDSIEMEIKEFSPPLSRLASHFLERWSFQASTSGKTMVVRTFELYPKNQLTRPALWLIARFLHRAVSKHTNEIIPPGDTDNLTT